MKSAYELAMERLDREAPDSIRTLTEQQKSSLADIERRYQAKRAEREIFLKQQIASARNQQDSEAVQQLERQLRDELTRLETEKESEKEQIRQQAKG